MEVYLDNSATTMCYPEVGELVYKVMCQDYGNPSSMHRKGVQAEHYIRDAKETLAKLLKVNPGEIFFTSGGTESDNLALIGCARAGRRRGNHLITTSIEHPAILNTMRYLEEEEVELAKKAGAHPVSLGKRVLRTETAGLTALSVLMYKLETV